MEEEILLTTAGKFKCKTSSTLQPAARYASKFMFDGNADTCWNSDQGSPQYILIDFGREVVATRIVFAFQGGFVGQDGVVETGSSLTSLHLVSPIHHLRDVNDDQVVSILPTIVPAQESIASPVHQGQYLKIVFNSSTDFYGRVTIYKLEVYGREASTT